MHVELNWIEKDWGKQEDKWKENYSVRDLDEDRTREARELKEKMKGDQQKVRWAEKERKQQAQNETNMYVQTHGWKVRRTKNERL